MTLIAGTLVWNGICVGADTRGTQEIEKGTYSYSDDIQKTDILPSGLGIAVAGNCYVASIYREILNNNFIENKKTNNSIDGPSNIIKEIIKKSLQELALDKRIIQIPAKKSHIAGLVFGVDKDIPLRLNSGECQRLLEIVKGKQVNFSVWEKYKKIIAKCANGESEYIEIEDFPQSILFSFESQFASASTIGMLEVNRIPFGFIEAFGSGKSNDHDSQQKNTLFYSLFSVDPSDELAVDDSAVHILRTHGWSEKVVPQNPKYSFQTFGGGYLAGAFLEYPAGSGIVTLRVTLGDYFRDAQRTDLVCSVYINSNEKLAVKTTEGKEWELIRFWEYKNKAKILLSST